MQITLRYRDEDITLNFENKEVIKVSDILKKLKLTDKTAFVVRNGEISQPHENIKGDDNIEVISVISGG